MARHLHRLAAEHLPEAQPGRQRGLQSCGDVSIILLRPDQCGCQRFAIRSSSDATSGCRREVSSGSWPCRRSRRRTTLSPRRRHFSQQHQRPAHPADAGAADKAKIDRICSLSTRWIEEVKSRTRGVPNGARSPCRHTGQSPISGRCETGPDLLLGRRQNVRFWFKKLRHQMLSAEPRPGSPRLSRKKGAPAKTPRSDR